MLALSVNWKDTRGALLNIQVSCPSTVMNVCGVLAVQRYNGKVWQPIDLSEIHEPLCTLPVIGDSLLVYQHQNCHTDATIMKNFGVVASIQSVQWVEVK